MSKKVLIDKQALIDKLMKIPGIGSNSDALKTIKRFPSYEPQKVKVPAFVAEYIEANRRLYLSDIFDGDWLSGVDGSTEDKTSKWLYDNEEEENNRRYLKAVQAFVEGYEVEEEPKYIVPVPNLSKEFFYTADGQHISFCQRRNIDDVKSKVKFTLKEVKRLFPELVDTVEKAEE